MWTASSVKTKSNPGLLLVHWLRDKTRPGRHPDGVRHLQLRCLHRPARRSQREVLQRACRAGRRQHHHHHPGSGRRPVAPGTRCRPRSRNATVCNAATAPRAWCWPRSTCCRRIPTRPTRRSEKGWKATSVAVPGYQNIVKSVAYAADLMKDSRPVTDRPTRSWPSDRHRRPPRRHHPVDRAVRPPQGGRPAADRHDQLDRQHPAARAPCTCRSSAARSRTPRSPGSTWRPRWPCPAWWPPSAPPNWATTTRR